MSWWKYLNPVHAYRRYESDAGNLSNRISKALPNWVPDDFKDYLGVHLNPMAMSDPISGDYYAARQQGMSPRDSRREAARQIGTTAAIAATYFAAPYVAGMFGGGAAGAGAGAGGIEGAGSATGALSGAPGAFSLAPSTAAWAPASATPLAGIGAGTANAGLGSGLVTSGTAGSALGGGAIGEGSLSAPAASGSFDWGNLIRQAGKGQQQGSQGYKAPDTPDLSKYWLAQALQQQQGQSQPLYKEYWM